MQSISGSELVGTRGETLVGRLPAERLVPLWNAVTSAVIKRGFAIEYRDLEPPRTGIFDGLKIVIDPDVDFEMQCFVLLHLFGHSVQWVAPSLVHKLDALQNTADKDRFLRVLHDYEHEAARFGLRLLHELGIHDLDDWFSDFVATDWQYVERYYREDRIPPWRECVTAGAPPVNELEIPKLVHRQVEVRFAF
ncbi:MAG TPA: hypothetical protein VGI40_28655 [Pirellulaceae bacterium]|jgi:hypothetical protein